MRDLSEIMASMKADINAIPSDDFVKRLAAYEKAVLSFRDELKLSGMATQCWTGGRDFKTRPPVL